MICDGCGYNTGPKVKRVDFEDSTYFVCYDTRDLCTQMVRLEREIDAEMAAFDADMERIEAALRLAGRGDLLADQRIEGLR